MNCGKQEIASSKMILDSLGPTLNQIKDNVDKAVSNNDEKSVEVNDVDMVKDVEMNGDVETKRISVSTQTDAINLNEELKKIVNQRMLLFNKTSIDDQSISEKLSPVLKKIQKENEELKKRAADLQTQLDSFEKQYSKRKKDVKVTSESTPSKSIVHINLDATTQQATVTAPHVTTVSGQPQNLQINHVPPNSVHPSPGNIRRPPTHVVHPVRKVTSQYAQMPLQQTPMQQLPRGQGPVNEGFMLIGGSSAGMQGVNTQVVATNHGLRMASLNNQRAPLAMRGPLPNNQFAFIPQGLGQGIPVSAVPWPMQQQVPQQQPLRMPMMQQPSPNNQLPVVGQVHQPSPSTTYPHLPRLKASISASGNGIILTWDFETPDNPEKYKVECYTLFANQAKDGRLKPPIDPSEWKKIGVVNALPLPMACTLTQFASGNIYHFSVVAVDIRGREGERSNPCTIRLNVNT